MSKDRLGNRPAGPWLGAVQPTTDRRMAMGRTVTGGAVGGNHAVNHLLVRSDYSPTFWCEMHAQLDERPMLQHAYVIG
jgi:hypothetical protein